MIRTQFWLHGGVPPFLNSSMASVAKVEGRMFMMNMLVIAWDDVLRMIMILMITVLIMKRMMMMTMMLLKRQHYITWGGGVHGCTGIVSSQASNHYNQMKY